MLSYSEGHDHHKVRGGVRIHFADPRDEPESVCEVSIPPVVPELIIIALK